MATPALCFDFSSVFRRSAVDELVEAGEELLADDQLWRRGAIHWWLAHPDLARPGTRLADSPWKAQAMVGGLLVLIHHLHAHRELVLPGGENTRLKMKYTGDPYAQNTQSRESWK